MIGDNPKINNEIEILKERKNSVHWTIAYLIIFGIAFSGCLLINKVWILGVMLFAMFLCLGYIINVRYYDIVWRLKFEK